jgi:hypothetical protein
MSPHFTPKETRKGNILIVCLYVDDMIYTRNLLLNEFKATMQSEFEMTDLGLMKYFLGIEVEQSEKGIFICQQKLLELLHTHLGFIFPKVFPCLLVIIQSPIF